MSELQLIRVSDNKRFLMKEDGTPFFWLGDTAWELFQKLDRKEVEKYLHNRLEHKFNVIQAVALSEFDDTKTGNRYGRRPFLETEEGYDPTQPDLSGEYNYWDHVDFVIRKAAELGLYIGLLPIWGDKFNKKEGLGPEIFTEERAEIYGEWLGKRYCNDKNIIWILGGDRPLETEQHYRIIDAMAEGLKRGDKGKHLMTFHPPGCKSSSDFVGDKEWLDFNMIQSSHGLDIANYKWISADYALEPIKPVLDGEPRYEDHPVDFKSENGYYDVYDVRQAAYWAVFAGAFGHTYGHHSIWSMNEEPGDYFIVTWEEALERPGGKQMKYLKKLIESRPFFSRVPAQELIDRQYPGYTHLQAATGEGYAFIYSPTGLPFKVNVEMISGERIKAYWYDPRNGQGSFVDEYVKKGTLEFIPPSSGRNNDWVLVLDDASKEFPVPGY